jgi:hypothetical protein
VLSARDENVLRFIFCDAEAYAGLKSSFGQQTDRIALAQLSPNAKKNHAPADPLSLSEMPIKSSRGGVGENRSMLSAERVVGFGKKRVIWTSDVDDGELAEFVTCLDVAEAYRALRALSIGRPDECRALRVLHLILGPRPPGEDREDVLGHLWPIAKYTDEVEVVRARLVEEEYVRQAAYSARAQAEIEIACRVWEPPAWPKFHGPFEEEWYDRFIRPTPCSLQVRDFERMRVSAERMVSSADALRARLALADDWARARFVAAVKVEAAEMYAQAEGAFVARRYA